MREWRKQEHLFKGTEMNRVGKNLPFDSKALRRVSANIKSQKLAELPHNSPNDDIIRSNRSWIKIMKDPQHKDAKSFKLAIIMARPAFKLSVRTDDRHKNFRLEVLFWHKSEIKVTKSVKQIHLTLTSNRTSHAATRASCRSVSTQNQFDQSSNSDNQKIDHNLATTNGAAMLVNYLQVAAHWMLLVLTVSNFVEARQNLADLRSQSK